jgi:ribosomal protein S18 acetylase RimI-like enzyme
MVTCNNDGAIGFYERLGFKKTGRTEPYPNDDTLMEFEMMLFIGEGSETTAM